MNQWRHRDVIFEIIYKKQVKTVQGGLSEGEFLYWWFFIIRISSEGIVKDDLEIIFENDNASNLSFNKWFSFKFYGFFFASTHEVESLEESHCISIIL